MNTPSETNLKIGSFRLRECKYTNNYTCVNIFVNYHQFHDSSINNNRTTGQQEIQNNTQKKSRRRRRKERRGEQEHNSKITDDYYTRHSCYIKFLRLQYPYLAIAGDQPLRLSLVLQLSKSLLYSQKHLEACSSY